MKSHWNFGMHAIGLGKDAGMSTQYTVGSSVAFRWLRFMFMCQFCLQQQSVSSKIPVPSDGRISLKSLINTKCLSGVLLLTRLSNVLYEDFDGQGQSICVSPIT